jgi:hypothetical protein
MSSSSSSSGSRRLFNDPYHHCQRDCAVACTAHANFSLYLRQSKAISTGSTSSPATRRTICRQTSDSAASRRVTSSPGGWMVWKADGQRSGYMLSWTLLTTCRTSRELGSHFMMTSMEQTMDPIQAKPSNTMGPYGAACATASQSASEI